jgi:hypothetical protein
MVTVGWRVLTDLPRMAAAFPKVVRAATAAGQKEALTTWKDRPAFPGLAYRFKWAASKDYGFSLRKEKYGSPTALRVNYAKAGLGMPREARPGGGRKGLSAGARQAPNIDKPWFINSGGTRARILARKPRSTYAGDTVTSNLQAGGFGINLVGAAKMRGVVSAHWVHVPVTYAMTVYKDAVNRAGAYKMMITRAIPRWIRSYASRTYRQEFEDLSQDLPWIKRLSDDTVRRNLRDVVVDERGRVRLRFRKAIASGVLDASEINLLRGGG